MKYIKENKKFLIFTTIVGIIGSIFAVVYTMKLVPEDMMEEAIKQVGSKELVIAISMIQPILYVVICEIFGVILSFCDDGRIPY